MDAKSVTIITGGGRGIGRAIALRMARETAVMVVGRTEKDLVSACEEISAIGGDAYFVTGDVSDPTTARTASEACHFRGLTVRNLVCNAGLGKTGAIESFDDVLWKQIVDVNVHGAFHFIKACLPAMLGAKRGTICIMSSVSGLTGSTHNAPYVASKHALVGLAKALAKEHGKNGIVTVAICPGFVESEMTERSIRKRVELRGMTETEALEHIRNVNPQKRIIPAEEVAEMIAFVCSGKVPSLSGSALILSGGA